ncbi:hypothetical protein AAE478_006587 [Parahypoxylon ruwenzoriense]
MSPIMATSPTSPLPFVDSDDLRTRFANAMSSMYRVEVPLYGDLLDIVGRVNAHVVRDGHYATSESSERLALERHGAIRLGTPYELRTVSRIFGVLGMHPVGYYDLSIAGLPMHATCFRPTGISSLDRNPFRVFTTLLRPELVTSEEARQLSLDLLHERHIFTEKLLALLDTAEAQCGRLTEEQADIFITEALFTFSWQPIAAATYEQYQILSAEHPILADIASFRTAHINHLTPRTLDIGAVQSAMRAAGMAVKSRIEGPPPRKCPILLRQTSFLALEEAVQFRTNTSGGANSHDPSIPEKETLVKAGHRARFGEIEQRGAAVTPKGRALYDRFLGENMQKAAGLTPAQVDSLMAEIFKQYPDDWDELRKQGLIYCTFGLVKEPAQKQSMDRRDSSLLERLIAEGYVTATPITYEDFLPFSAAGIFHSNLPSHVYGGCFNPPQPLSDRRGLQEALGREVIGLDDWYDGVQLQALEAICLKLGITVDELISHN